MSETVVRRLLVVGVSGYYGAALAQGFRDECEVYGTYNAHPARLDGVTCLPLDLTNGGEILDVLKRVHPDVVLYTAGLWDPVHCEEQKTQADLLNFKAATVFYRVATEPTHFVYYSTDDVFGQLDTAPETGFTEDSLASPTGSLGRTRYPAENAATGAGRGNAVLRVGRPYGEAFRSSANLAAGPLHAALESLASGRPTAFAQDFVRSPVYIGDVVRATRHVLPTLAFSTPSRLYNIGGADIASDYDLALEFARAFGIDKELVRPSALGTTRQGRAVRAPLNSSRCAAEFGFRPQGLRAGMREYAQRMRLGDTRGWLPA